MNISESRTYIEHVNGLFSVDVLRKLRAHLDEIEVKRQAKAATDRERLAIQRGETSDAVRLDPLWFEVWRGPTKEMLEKIGPFTWILFPVQVRLVRNLDHRVPWHQDYGYQRNLGARSHRRVITCFVPLDENPFERTTLQFSLAKAGELDHKALDGFGAGLEGPFEDTRHFQMHLGDALIFGDLAIHRTYVPEKAIVERRSIEYRLTKPEDSIPDKDYFDVKSGMFVRKGGESRAEL